MAQIFDKSSNFLSRFTILLLLLSVGMIVGAVLLVQWTPLTTHVDVTRDQPVPFSHAHHVGDVGLDCRYCHTSVEKSNFAGIPPTETCMGCHSQLFSDAPMLEQVRESLKTGKRLEWTRVNKVPEFVFFDHSIHIAKGVSCVSCHGQVEQMPLMAKGESLRMRWCLDCHRHPEGFIRPKEEVFNMKWESTDVDQEELGQVLREKYNVQPLTDCTACHR